MKRYLLFTYFLFCYCLAFGQPDIPDCPFDSSGTKVVFTLVDRMPVHPKGQSAFLAELFAGDF